MITNCFRGALFDLDGVLIDTEGCYTDFWAAVGERYHKSPTFAHDIKGTTLRNILATYFLPEEHDAIETEIHNFEDNMRYMIFDGVMDFLAALSASHIPMAIVTSSDDKKMKSLKSQLPELLEMMDAIVDGSMVRNSKPDPEGYITASELIHRQPCECVVFEDSLQGLEAGNRAGCYVVGLPTTNSRAKVEPRCHRVLDSWKNITVKELGFEIL